MMTQKVTRMMVNKSLHGRAKGTRLIPTRSKFDKSSLMKTNLLFLDLRLKLRLKLIDKALPFRDPIGTFWFKPGRST